MKNEISAIYTPGLRFKRGEYEALNEMAALSPGVASKVEPRLILPPPNQPDQETKRILTPDEFVHLTGERIGRYWTLKLAYIEPRFLFKALGKNGSTEWMPKIFKTAREYYGLPVPVANLEDLSGSCVEAFHKSIDTVAKTKLAVRITSGEIHSDLGERVKTAMTAIGLETKDCAVFIDFCDADFSNVSAIVDVLSSAFYAIQGIGVWQKIIFQGTTYPEKTPATEGSAALVERNEWAAWNKLIQQDNGILNGLTFGDYGADSAKFIFNGGGKPYRHYRYCTESQWLVVRGKADIEQRQAMKWVSQYILDSGKFAGRDFSSGDTYIFETAKGFNEGGNASTWRKVNTIHHITQVVSDLGRKYGFKTERRKLAEPLEQLDFFNS